MMSGVEGLQRSHSAHVSRRSIMKWGKLSQFRLVSKEQFHATKETLSALVGRVGRNGDYSLNLGII